MRVLVVAALMFLTLSVGATEREQWMPNPQIPASAGDRCVESVEVMRREHMHMLWHQRDRTVHQGFRDPSHSLRGCVECHVNRTATGTTIPVNEKDQFCAQCHAFVGITMDCFECHATTPDSGRRSNSSIPRAKQ